MFTFAEVAAALGENSEPVVIGDLAYQWGSESQNFFIIRFEGAEIARIGHGMVHGMMYLTGAGKHAMRLHNAILDAHKVNDLYRVVDNDGELWVSYDGTLREAVNGETDKNPGYIMGAIFFQRMYSDGVYHHYMRDSDQAMYSYLDFGIDVLGFLD